MDRKTIIHVIQADQRAVLLRKVKSIKKCETCGSQDFNFGFVYVAQSHNVVTGFTYECQECEQGALWAFEPMDSLTMVKMPLPKKVIESGKKENS